MPRTPTQRTHPASAVHPYSNPAQASYDHTRPPPSARPIDARSSDFNRNDFVGAMKAEQGDTSVDTKTGVQQGAALASGATPSSSDGQPGPSTSSSATATSATSSNAASSSSAASSANSTSNAQPQPVANGAKKKHVCPTCDRGFTTSGHLARHARVHTGERNHKCPFPGCETRCSRQDNLQQHYRIHLSPGSRRSASSAARAAAQNKAAAAAAVAAAAISTSPVQTSPVGPLGADDGPPPLAQAHPGVHPPSLAQASPYPHGPLSQSYPPMTIHPSPHLQQTNGVSAYSLPQTPPNGPYEVGTQPPPSGGLTNGHTAANGGPATGLGQSPPESPASHSTPSTGPSAHVPLPPSSYPPQYMNYPSYAPAGSAPKISTFYQRHHYPPEAYVGPPGQSTQPAISAEQRYQQSQSASLHPSDQLIEKERRRNRPSISSISSGQSPSQSPVITNGRPERSSVVAHDTASGHWQGGGVYVPYSNASATPSAATNGDGNYGITAPSAGSYAHATSSQTHQNPYAPPHPHPTPTVHYDMHSPPPPPPPQSTGSTASSNSVSSSILSEASHASSNTSYMSHANGPSDHGHGHGHVHSTHSMHPHSNGGRSPPPILAPIQSSLRGDPSGPGMAGLAGMGMGSVGGYHTSGMPRHHLHGRPPYGAVSYALAAESGYVGNGKAYDA